MTRQLVLKQVIGVFYLLFWVSPASALENFTKALIQASQNRQAIPHYSLFKKNATESDAYKVQHAYVLERQKQDSIAGYKAGLTSAAGQAKFKVSQALSGVLFSRGHLTDPNSISISSARKLMLETEIGFVLAKPITQQIHDLDKLKSMVEAIAPVIELPDLGYAYPNQLSGIDIIASNVAAHQFLLGTPQSVSNLPTLSQIETQLFHLQKLQFTGKANDALGDQWKALQWLVNQLISQGHELSAGELLITGALGKMIPARIGTYLADFGPLGKIEFTITP